MNNQLRDSRLLKLMFNHKKKVEKNLSAYMREHSRGKKTRRILRNCIFIFLGIGFLVDGIGYFVLRTGVFRTKDITVEGNRDISSQDILSAARAQIFDDSYLKYIFGFNNLLIWPEKFENINKLVPKIKSIEVDKSYLKKKIVLKVVERQGYGVWCMEGAEEKCFSFDDEGIIFSRGMPSEGSLIHNIRDYSERQLGMLLPVLSMDRFKYLKEIFDVLEAGGLNYKFLEIQNLNLEEVKAVSSVGPTIYFSLRFSPDFALAAMKEIGGGISKLEYVDFRVENKVYYK